MASFFRSTIMWRGGDAASAAQSPNLEVQRRQPEMEEQPQQQQQHQEERSRGSFPLSRRFMPTLFTRGRSNDTERREPVGDGEGGRSRAGEDSPKTPRLPSMHPARMDLPTDDIGRTWTRESSGPPLAPPHETTTPQQPPPSPSSAESPDSRRSSLLSLANTAQYPGVATPQPARQRSESGGRRRFEGPDPAELHLAALVDSERRRDRHRHRRRRRHERTQSGSRRNGRHHERGASDKEAPGRFLFCFPWVRSRRMRAQILKCFVSGLIMVATLSVYLALSISSRITSSESTILLILMVLFATIIFCHGLVRIFMLLTQRQRRGADGGDPERSDSSARHHHHHHQQHPYYLRNNQHPQQQMAEVMVPGGYAVPRRPIRVVLARDEEAAGREAETAKVKPPAYGAWRESVRVDPNKLYWQRIDGHHHHHHHHQAPGSTSESSSDGPHYSETRPGSAGTGTGMAARPPSYASDDGVAYVVEARPRSMAPLSDVAGSGLGSVSGSSSYYGASERGGPRSSSSGGTAWPARSAR
ncbi:hypothetical protein DL764_005755 [Monosporascus ibericus]|uniref:Uncharacterized protein n=1 Tax=Monosporascus ibericus TaxID=155417 RepID=A0A4Q4TAZ1_9PEZI|nr:hypothetical protein DL764_005755 [Monosporascus ibericus]